MKKIIAIILVVSSNLAGQNSRQWATYVGGTNQDYGTAIATDSSCNVIIGGSTMNSPGFGYNGYQNNYGGGPFDGFLSKYDAAGGLLWSTYVGGNGEESVWDIAIDRFGFIYVSGQTSSTSNFASAGFQNNYGGGLNDAFLAKYTAAGALVWLSYYGGPGDDWGYCVSFDDSGNVFLGGTTNSTAGIASNGFQNTYGGGFYDSYLVKFDSACNRIWATYFGAAGNQETAWGVATSSNGDVFLTGITNSTSGVAYNGMQSIYGGGQLDGFLVRFSNVGSRIWATYYGGNMSDDPHSIKIDQWDHIFIGGSTTGSNNGIATFGSYQQLPGGVNDVFLSRFDTTGSLIWGTYYGGNSIEKDGRVSLDHNGNVFLSGTTYSQNAIAVGGYRNNLVGSENGFVAKFDTTGNRYCATYYGETMEELGLVAADEIGNVYLVIGITSTTTNMAWNGYQNSFAGASDACLVKFSACSSPFLGCASSYNVSCYGDCTGHAVASAGGGVLPYSYTWSTVPPQTTQVATGLCAGTYSVVIADANNDSISMTVTITEPPALTMSVTHVDSVDCFGMCNASASVSGNGGSGQYSFLWSSIPIQQNDTATGLCAGTYLATITDSLGCVTSDSISIVQPNAMVIASDSIAETCSYSDGSAYVSVTGGTGPYQYLWNNMATDDSIAGLVAGTYIVYITDANGCLSSDTIVVTNSMTANANAGIDDTLQYGQSTTLTGMGGITYQWYPGASLNCETCADPIASPTVTTTYILTVTDSTGCEDSDTVQIVVVIECNVFVPNAFSPNGDDENDILFVRGLCISSMQFKIFNRWGECVFRSDSQIEGWDGTWRGYPCEPAVFTYVLVGYDTYGNGFRNSGNVTLVR